MRDCVFCKIIKKEIPAIVLYEDADVIAFQSLENHPLVVPKRHIVDVFDLDEKTGSSIMKAAVKIAKATKHAFQAEGIHLSQVNGAAAGQDVFHFHLHIIPRWSDDGIKPIFDTAVKDESERKNTAEKIKEKIHTN